MADGGAGAAAANAGHRFPQQCVGGGARIFVDAFRAGVRETGYIERQTVAIEYNWAGDDADRLNELAAK